MRNLPIYRGLKLGTEDEYIEGFLKNCTDTGLDIFWIQSKEFIDYRINPTTLSINFPDMIDSQGNKIFASLRKDGKGGDVIKYEMYTSIMHYKKIEPKIKISKCIFSSKGFNMGLLFTCNDYYGIKILGIKK